MKSTPAAHHRYYIFSSKHMRTDARYRLIFLEMIAATLLLGACAGVSLDEPGRTPTTPGAAAPVPGTASTPNPGTASAPWPGTAPAPQTPSTRATPAAPSGVPPTAAAPHVRRPSHAPDARAYRRDAAAHLYALNAERIYKGVLQPNLYAIGVLDVDIDRRGEVLRLHWRRAPSHAPEVVREIERTVRAAAPFPEPMRMGRVTYTDVWLWDKSGRFQLDTLTEGQL